MFIIGIDPHKGSHTAAVIDPDEELVGELSLQADCRQRERLLRWASSFDTAVVGDRRCVGSRCIVGAAAGRVGRDGC